MDLELITIGTELLLGFVIDTNAADLARALASVGARVVRRSTVADDGPAIEREVRDALARTGFVVATGGLGPTRDDITKKVVAGIFDAPFELDREYLDVLRQRFERMGRGPMPEVNRTQAEIPRGAAVLPNRWGTAPGLWLEGPLGVVVLLPGVPREMRGLLEHELLPRLKARTGGDRARPVILSRTLRTTGTSESALAELLGPAEDRITPVTLAYLPSVAGVDLRLTSWSRPESEGTAALEAAVATLRPALGSHLYGEDEADLAAVVLAALAERGSKLAVAESCTGGMLSARITAIPGASRIFLGGVVAYHNDVKLRELEVPLDLLAEHGAVSGPVAEAMARGVGRRYAADASVAITGIAGPDGGTPEKPVGTVWLAARLGDTVRLTKVIYPFGREDVRARSAQAGLDLLRRLLQAA